MYSGDPDLWVPATTKRTGIYEWHYFDPSWCENVVTHVKRINPERWIQRHGVGSQGEVANYKLLDGYCVIEHLPAFLEVHKMLRGEVMRVLDRFVVPSPHHRSAINIRLYEEGDNEGRHYDTQSAACLLFLTGGEPLMIQRPDGDWHSVYPEPGKVAIFEGRERLHYVPAGLEGDYRLSVPFNYQETYADPRPAYIDRMLYDNMSYEDATREEVS